MWDAVSGAAHGQLQPSRSWVSAIDFDPTGKLVLIAPADSPAVVADGARGEPVGGACEVISTADPLGRYVAVGCKDHPVRVWDTAHDRLLAELPSSTEVAARGYTSAFPAVSAGGERAAIARGNAVEVYELPGARLVRTVAHRAPVSAIAFAPRGRDVISGALDGALIITRDDGTVQSLPSAAGVDLVALLPDGKAVTCDAQRRLRIHDPGGAAP